MVRASDELPGTDELPSTDELPGTYLVAFKVSKEEIVLGYFYIMKPNYLAPAQKGNYLKVLARPLQYAKWLVVQK